VPGETPAPAFVVPHETPPPPKVADVLPAAGAPAQAASFVPSPLTDPSAKGAAPPAAKTAASAGSDDPAHSGDGSTADKVRDAYIRLKRKGLSVDVDTMLFPEDRDLFFQVSVPPLPGEAAGDPTDPKAGSGRSRTPAGSGDLSSNSQVETNQRSQADDRSRVESDSRTRNTYDASAQTTSRNVQESDSRAKIDTTQRIEIKTENVPYPQPTPQVVFVTPPPSPTPPPGTVQKLFLEAQKLAYARRYDFALNRVEKAMEIEPGNAVLHALHGSIYYKMGLYDSARNSWNKALQLDPTMNDVRERLMTMSNKQSRTIQ
jgi:tetratricopeptide (TPR) repeat protein